MYFKFLYKKHHHLKKKSKQISNITQIFNLEKIRQTKLSLNLSCFTHFSLKPIGMPQYRFPKRTL